MIPVPCNGLCDESVIPELGEAPSFPGKFVVNHLINSFFHIVMPIMSVPNVLLSI